MTEDLKQYSQFNDAVHIAAQLGRFDLATMLLTIVAIILALGGIFAFLEVKRNARKIAREAAEEIAEKISEQTANKYLVEKLPEILDAYREFIGDRVDERITREVANRIALAQDDDGESDNG